jgi:hypothetical protein
MRTFPKCGARLRYRLILDRLFWECPHPGALPSTELKDPVVVTVTIEISVKSGKVKRSESQKSISKR